MENLTLKIENEINHSNPNFIKLECRQLSFDSDNAESDNTDRIIESVKIKIEDKTTDSHNITETNAYSIEKQQDEHCGFLKDVKKESEEQKVEELEDHSIFIKEEYVEDVDLDVKNKKKKDETGIIKRETKAISKEIACDRSHECSTCGKRFAKLVYLKRHTLVHTGKKAYQCEVCNKCFAVPCNLKRHKLVHTGEKPYHCDICNKYFANLKRHKLSHTGEKPYQCDVCEKYFNQISTLSRHKVLHTGEKPYPCDECNKSFSRLDTLKSHKQLHTGEKPYQCDGCDKSFNRFDTLKTHKLLHTDDNPIKCDVCNKRFVKANYLRRHKLLHVYSTQNQ